METHTVNRALACVFIFLSATVSAQHPPPLLTEAVNDFAGIIDVESKREIERRIQALRDAAGDTIAVATIKTYKPEYADIREYAVRMFENQGRGIGERGKDNGLLIVVAVDDRQMGIEVGYGLEGTIPDGFAGQIRDLMRPEFRAGEYGRGLLQGVTVLAHRIAAERGVSLESVPRQQVPRQVPISADRFPWKSFLLMLFILWLVSRSRRGRRRRYWGRGPWSGWNSGVGPFGGSIGGFGGGFGGFGGGGFGGGRGGGFGGFGGGRSGGGGAAGGW